MLPVFCRYLWMLIWPANLSIEYWPEVRQALNGPVIFAAMILAVVAVAIGQLFRLDRILGFWALYFWLFLLPVSQIVPLLVIMYDHYLYFPILGVGALAGSAAIALRQRLSRLNARILITLLAILLVVMAGGTFYRCAVWRDALTLWSDAAVKTPGGYRVWYLLAGAYLRAGRQAEAAQAYEHSLQLNSTSSDVYLALGDLYVAMGEPEKGYVKYRKLLEVNPKYVMGWAALGSFYRDRGDFIQAEAMYQRAYELQPEALQITILRGSLALASGKLPQARMLLEQVERAGWHDPTNAYYLACVEAVDGNIGKSLEWLEMALRRGYRDSKTIASNKQLAGLRNDPRYLELKHNYFTETLLEK
jgi:tetratricopeptide (TPR) repeat protein